MIENITLHPIIFGPGDHKLTRWRMAKRVQELLLEDYTRLPGVFESALEPFVDPNNDEIVQRQANKIAEAALRNLLYLGVYTEGDCLNRWNMQGVIKISDWNGSDEAPFSTNRLFCPKLFELQQRWTNRHSKLWKPPRQLAICAISNILNAERPDAYDQILETVINPEAGFFPGTPILSSFDVSDERMRRAFQVRAASFGPYGKRTLGPYVRTYQKVAIDSR